MARALALAAISLIPVACKPYRIEYRQRPSFYEAATGRPAPDREVLPDGTIVVYRDGTPRGTLQKQSEDRSKPFLIREETEDGRVILRALLPEHVLVNLMTCLRYEEYELLWDQLLAEETREAYRSRGLGEEDFAEFFAEHRYELGATVNRMLHGLPRNEVIVDNPDQGITRLRFHPLIADTVKFKTVLLRNEQGGLKLLRIE